MNPRPVRDEKVTESSVSPKQQAFLDRHKILIQGSFDGFNAVHTISRFVCWRRQLQPTVRQQEFLQKCGLWREGMTLGEASEGDATFRWTHILYVSKEVDIRDNYPNAPDSRVYIPDDTGTGFDIVFVEIVNRGDPTEHKRVYLDRRDPTWPTNQL